jgi:hypothetical protein
MAKLRRVPPGRAGWLWLAARLRAGRLAADLLDRKLRVLLVERDRFRLIEDRTRKRWRMSWREADLWALRATMLSGQRDLRLSATRATGHCHDLLGKRDGCALPRSRPRANYPRPPPPNAAPARQRWSTRPRHIAKLSKPRSSMAPPPARVASSMPRSPPPDDGCVRSRSGGHLVWKPRCGT